MAFRFLKNPSQPLFIKGRGLWEIFPYLLKTGRKNFEDQWIINLGTARGKTGHSPKAGVLPDRRGAGLLRQL
jgi:hypothetical protein